ncbi:hypothetical protein D1BOALGB6SA_1674 [Olavius sp. associated proteobacterium Delta 1]|nr:hypothetical protein D1BOALGB6SA_1674 [Olavius sp. associated proteobacterium Delta 1]
MILLRQDFDSESTEHFSMSPDDSRYTINMQAATQSVQDNVKVVSNWFR